MRRINPILGLFVVSACGSGGAPMEYVLYEEPPEQIVDAGAAAGADAGSGIRFPGTVTDAGAVADAGTVADAGAGVLGDAGARIDAGTDPLDPARCGIALTASGVLDIDIPTVRITGRVTLNGAALPAVTTGLPTLFLRHTETPIAGHFLDLAKVQRAGGAFDVRVIPGTYDVIYDTSSACTHGGAYPCQQGARIRSALRLTTNGAVNIDLSTVRLTGRVTLNGTAWPASADANLGFVATSGSYLNLNLRALPSSAYDIRLFRDTFDIWYASNIAASACRGKSIPCQTSGVVRAAIPVTADGSLDINIETVRLTGRVTLNGAALPAASPESEIGLTSQNGAKAKLTALADTPGTFDVQVFKGTYDIFYGRGSATCASSPYPCQKSARIGGPVVVTASGALDINIPTVRITGRVTLNGAAPPAGSVKLSLRDARGSTPTVFQFSDGTDRFDRRFIPGTYDIMFHNLESCEGSLLPCGSGAVVRSGVTFMRDGSYDIDLRTIRVIGRVTLNGAPAPEELDIRAWIDADGADFSIAPFVDDVSRTATFDVRLFAGLYESWFRHSAVYSGCAGSVYPCMERALVRSSVALTSDGALDIDIPTIRLTGRITLNGAALTAQHASPGLLSLRGGGGATGTLATLDTRATSSYDTRIAPGKYNIVYAPIRGCDETASLPCQTRILRGCVSP
ncbi:MAG: hypothetical protein HYY84_13310 [Deltaproteobacteria bacterium]|nr:hypothetical protein [Deltaproteobacteria bacterium]